MADAEAAVVSGPSSKSDDERAAEREGLPGALRGGAWQDLANDLAALRAYLVHYGEARKNAIRAQVRRALLGIAVGIVGAVVVLTVVGVAVALVLLGIARGVGELLGATGWDRCSPGPPCWRFSHWLPGERCACGSAAR